ncbi:hypothetical protein C8T65DRAFT_738117 [Cerioporus squamosus]|nr:hypothetical protein C8T65DRAFT_738117 [Cerioporus squamosus]
MNGCHLPVELCERIIDFVGVSNCNEGTVNYPTLRSRTLMCCAWLPRTRYNFSYRVVLRTSTHLECFISTRARTASCYRVRELELGLPRWEQKETDGWVSLKEQPSLAALLCANLTHVDTLVLSRMQWVYPRRSLKIMSQFAPMRTLELYYVRFPSPSNLGQVLLSLPHLRELRCAAVDVHYPGNLAWRPRRRAVDPQPLRVLKVNGRSSVGPFILHNMAESAQWLESLSIRSSFVSWSEDAFNSLSSYKNLIFLRLVLASPTATLSHVPTRNLRTISISFEPGLGSCVYLPGSDGPGVKPIQADTTDSKPEPEPEWWSYGSQSGAAMQTLLGLLERSLVDDGDDGRTKESFGNLHVVRVRIRDTSFKGGGRDTAWWLAEAVKAAPTLHVLGLLRIIVARDWPNDELLWPDERAGGHGPSWTFKSSRYWRRGQATTGSLGLVGQNAGSSHQLQT